VVAGMQIDATGVLTGAAWIILKKRDELQDAACREV
jgi:hypothetical protein